MHAGDENPLFDVREAEEISTARRTPSPEEAAPDTDDEGDRRELSDPELSNPELSDPEFRDSRAEGPLGPGDPGSDQEQDEGYWVERALDLETELARVDDDTARIDILLEIGVIWRDELSERDAAASAFERVLEIDPRNDEAFADLERIYALQGESAKLATLLLHGAEQSESVADRVEYMQRVAQLYELHAQPDKALLVLEAAMEAAPDHPTLADQMEQLRRSAAALYDERGGPPTPDPLIQIEAERAVSDPIGLLERQLEQTETEAERADLYEQLACLWLRERDDRDKAVDCLRRALRLDPGRSSALDELERIYGQTDELELLAKFFESQARDAPDTQVERRLIARLAKLFEGPLDDPARALDAYERHHALDATDQGVLHRIIRLAREMGHWEKVVEALAALASFPRSENEQAGLLHQIGLTYQHQLGDMPSAEQYYSEALEIDPAHIPSLTRLGDMYRSAAEWSKLTGILQRAEAYSGQPSQRADLLFQAGSIHLAQLRDAATAAELLERSLKLDAHRRAAVELLGRIYWQTERFERLEPLLETLLRTCAPEAPAERLALTERLAEVAEKLGKLDIAIEQRRAAHELDPDAPQRLIDLADLSYRSAAWEQAHRAYGELLAREQEIEIDHDLLQQARKRLAKAAQALGKIPEAIAALRLVLAREEDKESRALLADLLLTAESWPEAAELKEQILADANDADAFALRVDLGDVYAQRLSRPDLAQQHYEHALGLQPEDRATLHRLVDLCSTTKQWPRTIQVCARLAEIETDGKLRAKYLYASAVIARDELGNDDHALKLFNETLDADPQRIKAFREIDELCTRKHDWKALAHNYGKMLRRLPKKGYRKLKARLWQNLGEVLRTHRRDYIGAIEAFSAALRLDPADVELRHVLAELYLKAGADYRSEAIDACHELIRIDPAETDPYHALRRIYLDSEQFDRTWCICAALSFLKHASDSERSFFRQYRARALLRAGAQLTDDLWQRVLNHPSQDRHLNAIFALVANTVGEMTARTHADFGILRDDRADLNDDSELLLVVARYVSAVLAVPHPDLHLRPEQPGAMLMAHTSGAPSFVAGAHLLGRNSRREMAFIVAKQLTFLRPEYFLRYAMNAPERLEVVLQAIFELCERDYGASASGAKLVNRTVAHLKKRLHRAEVEQLQQLVERLASKGRVDLLKWWNTTDLTADRVGLLLCNDLEVAARMIGAEPGGAGGFSRSERVKKLVQFLCSEPYFMLRERLGLTIAQHASVGESRGAGARRRR